MGLGMWVGVCVCLFPDGHGGWIISSSALFSCRFEFLQSWHQFNSYYEFKKNYFLQKEGRCFPEVCVECVWSG